MPVLAGVRTRALLHTGRMVMRHLLYFWAVLALALMLGAPASADDFSFSTGEPDGLMAAASRPESRGHQAIRFARAEGEIIRGGWGDRKSTRLNSSHITIS